MSMIGFGLYEDIPSRQVADRINGSSKTAFSSDPYALCLEKIDMELVCYFEKLS